MSRLRSVLCNQLLSQSRRKMKILYVCKSLPHSFQGGIQTHVWKLSEYMSRLGHDVTILTAGSWRKGEKRYDMDGRHIIEIPYLPMRRQSIMSWFLEELSFNIAIKRWLSQNVTSRLEDEKERFDLIHLQGRSGFTFPQSHNALPIITTFHGLISVENKKAHKSGIQKYVHEGWASYFEKNALKNSNAIIAVSREMQDEIADFVPEMKPKITILPNGVSIPTHTLPTPSLANTRGKTLLFVGRLDRIKGVFNLIEAMKSVESDIQLVIIGDGSERQNLEKLLDTEGYNSPEFSGSGARERVKLLGALPNEKVLEWVAQCDALILPSFHETQGIVLLEANACGKPVIASNINGIKEVVKQGYNGLLCNPYNPKHIAETINRLFSDAETMAKMGENGRQLVARKYNWSTIAQQTEKVYHQVILDFEELTAESTLPSQPISFPIFSKLYP